MALACEVFDDPQTMGAAAAARGSQLIRTALADRQTASIVLASAASQIDMLAHLVKEPDIDWRRVTAFHLDEYIGISPDHPASFRRYLRERFCSELPMPLCAIHYIETERNSEAECQRLESLIRQHPIDVAFIGIGENGHLAFNDPPADFYTTSSYHVVALDHVCRYQQYKEGWFPTLSEVPQQAISMTIPQIMRCSAIVCTVPDERKAHAVQQAVEGVISPDLPASILQTHPSATLFLDAAAASLLKKSPRFDTLHGAKGATAIPSGRSSTKTTPPATAIRR